VAFALASSTRGDGGGSGLTLLSLLWSSRPWPSVWLSSCLSGGSVPEDPGLDCAFCGRGGGGELRKDRGEGGALGLPALLLGAGAPLHSCGLVCPFAPFFPFPFPFEPAGFLKQVLPR